MFRRDNMGIEIQYYEICWEEKGRIRLELEYRGSRGFRVCVHATWEDNVRQGKVQGGTLKRNGFGVMHGFVYFLR